MTIKIFQDLFVPLFIQEIHLFLNNGIKKRLSKSNIKLEKDNHCKGVHNNQEECASQVFNYYVDNYKILTKRTLNILYEKVFFYLLEEGGNSVREDEREEIKKLMDGIYQLTKNGLYHLISYGVFHHPDVIEYLNDINTAYVEYNKQQIDYLDNIPYVEQKTEEWFALRKNMISASIAGYIDSKDCGLGISKETEQIKEKTDLKEKKNFSWGCFPLRHGQQYEDVTGHIYDTFNGLTSKEYGILPDKHYTHIGASPDGIIIGVKDESNFNHGRMMGRMREIKNPVSRKINHKIPSYYYWQMQQQMYVCNLPVCDFIQTSFKYDADSVSNCYRNFKNDTFDFNKLVNAKCWQDIKNELAGYILQNLNYDVFWNYLVEYNIDTQPLDEIEEEIIAIFVNEFTYICPIPLENISQSGFLKGVMWCLTKADESGNVDFKVEWTPMNISIENEQYINDIEKSFLASHEEEGFTLDEKHFWVLEDYKVIEVEYNQGLYEGKNYILNGEDLMDTHHNDDCIIKRLGEKWQIVEELRSIEDMDTRKKKYENYYPSSSSNDKKSSNAYSSYKSKYKKKKTSTTSLSNDSWTVRDNDIIYDLS